VNKVYYTWQQVEGAVLDIARQMFAHDWKPEYIVGLTRGGLVPANLLSQYTGIPMHTLNVSLRDSNSGESNLWMAEDAFKGKKILIVDDINDTGATIDWIKQDWPSGCFPHSETWNTLFGYNVRFAAVFDNLASKANVKMNYTGEEINKAEKDVWIDFPFEDWWTK